MKKNTFTKLEKNWIYYDVGNSAFTLLVTIILPIYFKYLAEQSQLTSQEYLAYWGYGVTISTLLVAVIGPYLGSIADKNQKKKFFFILSLIVGAGASFSFPLWQTWLSFLVVFVISKIGYNASLIFYDSMLIDVTTDERMDRVSTYGYAWGYLGSCLPFILSIVSILYLPTIGMDFLWAMTIAFCINALWWIGFSIPLIQSYRQKYVESAEETKPIEVIKTLKQMRKNPKVFYFLLAFFFYIDGVYTIINMATAYGESLGLDSTGLLLALLTTQIVAFPSSLFISYLSKKIPTHKLISICILAYTAIALFAVQLDKLWEFWLLAICVGLFQGGIQALSRSYFAKIIPKEKSGQYFGIYDIFGKGASILGTFIVSFLTHVTGNQSLGIGSMVILFILGFFFFKKSSHLLEE